jgi:hypothetical protein
VTGSSSAILKSILRRAARARCSAQAAQILVLRTHANRHLLVSAFHALLLRRRARPFFPSFCSVRSECAL